MNDFIFSLFQVIFLGIVILGTSFLGFYLSSSFEPLSPHLKKKIKNDIDLQKKF